MIRDKHKNLSIKVTGIIKSGTSSVVPALVLFTLWGSPIAAISKGKCCIYSRVNPTAYLDEIAEFAFADKKLVKEDIVLDKFTMPTLATAVDITTRKSWHRNVVGRTSVQKRTELGIKEGETLDTVWKHDLRFKNGEIIVDEADTSEDVVDATPQTRQAVAPVPASRPVPVPEVDESLPF